METSTEKPLSVSNGSCNLRSKALKGVDKFQQTYQPEACSNLDLVSELDFVMTNDKNCQTDFQSEIGRPRYTDIDHLISALNKHIKSLEKRVFVFPGPRPFAWPSAPAPGPGPQFVFTNPGPQFGFTDPTQKQCIC